MAELLSGISAHELAEWEAFHSIEPFGDVQEDLRAGWQASVAFNAWRGPNTAALRPWDFFPSLEELGEDRPAVDRRAEIVRMRSEMAGWVAASGGKVL